MSSPFLGRLAKSPLTPKSPLFRVATGLTADPKPSNSPRFHLSPDCGSISQKPTPPSQFLKNSPSRLAIPNHPNFYANYSPTFYSGNTRAIVIPEVDSPSTVTYSLCY